MEYGDARPIQAGGVESGDGGLIETSGKNYLDVSGSWTDASAANGTAGTWLLDPISVGIVSGATIFQGAYSGGNPDVFAPATGNTGTQVGADTINSRLNAGTSVTVTTDSGNAADNTENGDAMGTLGDLISIVVQNVDETS